MTPEEIEKNRLESERLFKLPKRFVDNSRILVGEGHVLFCLYFGESVEALVLTPHQAKRFSQLLAYQIEFFERTQQTIPASWSPANIASPIQPDDLQNPPEDSAPESPKKPK